MLVRSSWTAVALLAAALGAGCATADTTGSSGSGGESSTSITTGTTTTSTTTTTTTTGSTTTSSTTSTTTAGSGGGGTGGSTSNGSGGMAPCVEIDATTFSRIADDLGDQVYGSPPAQNIVGAGLDMFEIEFYEPNGGDQTGMFDLSQAPNDNYETCGQCVLAIADYDATRTIFYASQGTIDIDPASLPQGGKVDMTFTDVTLVEVTIDTVTLVSTPVPNGLCLHLASASFSIDLSPPAGWTCSASYYGDGTCDCGCGSQDSDCASTTDVNECVFSNNCGSVASLDPANTPKCICDAVTEFACTDGGCVDITYKCDTFDDCFDASDELGCP